MPRIKITGIVQGIGMRPFIYNQALDLGLKGSVMNTSSGLEILIQGHGPGIKEFIRRIKKKHPRSAVIERIEIEPDQNGSLPFNTFSIEKSSLDLGSTFIPPDLALCEKCVRELYDLKDRRFSYAFINCTNCGPRYSIIESLPYDRPGTSMKDFKMCRECSREYKDPHNRRFHAQPDACPVCGPKLTLLDKDLVPVQGDPIENAKQFLRQGKIVAVKGIGGFHISCDATNERAVDLLRKRKNRPHKPFAIMTSLSRLRSVVHARPGDIELLRSPVAPILLLKKKELNPCSENVSPDNPFLGVFLPYTPVHYLLLEKGPGFLVMTSGNISEEPLAAEAEELKGLCDFFLVHDRPILNRSDDSVIAPGRKADILIRRSRGLVPSPVRLPLDTVPTLGTGAELKLCFSLCIGRRAFLSPFIGDSDSKKTMDFYLDTLEKYERWFKITPELVACDLHPDYFTSKLAREMELPLIPVQHHFAHVASIMAEHALAGPVIGIAYDGTGYGTDRTIWGSEIMVVQYTGFERMFHLNNMPLVNGDAAIKNPYRIALAYLLAAGEEPELASINPENEKNIIQKQLETHFNVLLCSSMGRLFDCVDAMLGRIRTITFEAQAAMDLEFLADTATSSTYEYEISGQEINIIPMLKAIMRDIRNRKNARFIAGAFHNTIIQFTIDAVIKTSKLTGIKRTVLSGGVMQNRVLLEGLIKGLAKNDLKVFVPKSLPFNDSSLSIGQAVIANVLGHSR